MLRQKEDIMRTFMVCLLCVVLGIIPVFAKTTTWTSAPEVGKIDKPSYTIEFEPTKSDSIIFDGFRLTVTNKSAKTLEIDWNKTRYIQDGKTKGLFYYEGIDSKSIKNKTIKPDVIGAGKSLSKNICPAKLISYAPIGEESVRPGKKGISCGLIPKGDNGIGLSLRLDGQTVNERLMVTIQEK